MSTGRAATVTLGVFAGFVLVTTLFQSLQRCGWIAEPPEPVASMARAVEPFRSLNDYGLFAVMTTSRPEIQVEGSEDGQSWKLYTFRWKPGELDHRPRFAFFHMPRLDWQMWFAALSGGCTKQPWFLRFEGRLFEGSPQVLSLLRHVPFGAKPPRFLRAQLFLYRFSRPGEVGWWTREEVAPFCPPITAEDLRGAGLMRP
jgi:hypothetical protein